MLKQHENAERAETAESSSERFSAISPGSALNVGFFSKRPELQGRLASRPYRVYSSGIARN
jgi:hypothetical protein